MKLRCENNLPFYSDDLRHFSFLFLSVELIFKMKMMEIRAHDTQTESAQATKDNAKKRFRYEED